MEPTQFDNSCLDKICGLNGSYCKQCHHNSRTTNMLQNIQNGFEVMRSLEETLTKYHELLQHPIVQRGGDFMKIPPEVSIFSKCMYCNFILGNCTCLSWTCSSSHCGQQRLWSRKAGKYVGNATSTL